MEKNSFETNFFKTLSKNNPDIKHIPNKLKKKKKKRTTLFSLQKRFKPREPSTVEGRREVGCYNFARSQERFHTRHVFSRV